MNQKSSWTLSCLGVLSVVVCIFQVACAADTEDGSFEGLLAGSGSDAYIGNAGAAGIAGISTGGVAGVNTIGSAGTITTTAAAGKRGAAGTSGNVKATGGKSSAGASGGKAGKGAAGSAGAAGSGAPNEMDLTAVCKGGKVGQDSDAVTTRGQTSSRNFSIVMYNLSAPNKITRFQTILPVPKVPSARSTLFIWPGLQHSGGADPARIGNGVLQPVLTWGPSCNPNAYAKGNDYAGWWISAMYVNLSGAAGLGGCAGGDAMDVAVADRLYIDFAVKGTEWTQTVVNLNNKKTVDFTFDLEGQDQNWVIWDIETPGTSRPAEDTFFEKSVITFTSPVTSCQPSSAAEVDYFSAPILSPDGLNCCYEKMILKAQR
jgi:hypothetical protein